MSGLLLVGLAAVGAALFLKGAQMRDDKQEQADLDFFRFDSLFQKWGAVYSVPWTWLKAIALNESDLGRHPLVKAGLASTDGKSWGIMQVTLTTARDLDANASIDLLNKPEYSIRLAAQYMRQLMKLFKDDQRKAIMSYNQGPGNTQKGREYAAEYYERFLRNLKRVEETQV